MRIAVDAMGGDHAPEAIVEGVVGVADRVERIYLVGVPEALEPLLERWGTPDNLELTPSGPAVPLVAKPVAILRKTADASIRVAAELVRRGNADALLSAGHTGAVVAAARLYLDRVKGVKRTAIAVTLPTLGGGDCVLLDAGATVRARPAHLVQFAVMGASFARIRNNVERPRVGLLDMGSEAGRLAEVRKAHGKLQSSGLDYAGYVEGEQVFSGDLDVVVCEGFVGNALLKLAEGLVHRVGGWLAEQQPGGSLLSDFRRATDFSEVGGAPLLGTRSPCIICHGKSDAKAIGRAVAGAAQLGGLHEAMQRDLERHRVSLFA